MSEGPLPYAVLIADPAQYRPADLARVLAGLRKVPVQDVLAAARSCWGIVEKGIAEAEARKTAEALSAAGISSTAVPETLIEDLPAAKPISKLSLSPEGIFPEVESGRPVKVPWGRLALVAAAAFKQTTVKTVKSEEGPGFGQKALKIGLTLATGMPMGLGGGKKEVVTKVESTDLLFFLDLLLREPAERLRIDAHDFDYSCLKAKMGYNALGNFRQLLLELTGGAKAAWSNRGTRILLDSKPVREMGYESLDGLDRESRWLLTLLSLLPQGG